MSLCKNCGYDGELHRYVIDTWICPTSLWAETVPEQPPDTGPPPGGTDPGPGTAHQWSWDQQSQLITLPTNEDPGISITFVPDREGMSNGIVIDPASINPAFPNGYNMTICISTVQGKFDEPQPWSATGPGGHMYFQVGGSPPGWCPLLELGKRYFFNARVNERGQMPSLRYTCWRPA